MNQNWAQNVSEKNQKTEQYPKQIKNEPETDYKRTINEPKRTRNGPISDQTP